MSDPNYQMPAVQLDEMVYWKSGVGQGLPVLRAMVTSVGHDSIDCMVFEQIGDQVRVLGKSGVVHQSDPRLSDPRLGPHFMSEGLGVWIPSAEMARREEQAARERALAKRVEELEQAYAGLSRRLDERGKKGKPAPELEAATV